MRIAGNATGKTKVISQKTGSHTWYSNQINGDASRWGYWSEWANLLRIPGTYYEQWETDPDPNLIFVGGIWEKIACHSTRPVVLWKNMGTF